MPAAGPLVGLAGIGVDGRREDVLHRFAFGRGTAKLQDGLAALLDDLAGDGGHVVMQAIQELGAVGAARLNPHGIGRIDQHREVDAVAGKPGRGDGQIVHIDGGGPRRAVGVGKADVSVQARGGIDARDRLAGFVPARCHRPLGAQGNGHQGQAGA